MTLQQYFGFEARAAFRALVQNRRVSLFVIFTLWLGVTLSAGSILAFRRLVLQPLPLPHSEQLHSVRRISKVGSSGLALSDIERVAGADLFSAVGGYRSQLMTMSADVPVRVSVATVTERLLETLGLELIAGQGLDGTDAAAALLDETFWRASFGADRAALGRSFVLDGRTYRVAGIVAAGAILEDRPFQVWVPAPLASSNGSFAFFTTIGRLRPGIPRADAEAAAAQLLGYGSSSRIALEPLNSVVVGNTKEITVLVLVGSLGILVASCAVVILFLLVHLMSGVQLHGLVMRSILGATGLALGARVFGLIAGLVAPAAILAMGSLILLERMLPLGIGSSQDAGGWDGFHVAAVAIPCMGVLLVCFFPIYVYILGARLEAGIARAGRAALPESGWLRGLMLGSVVALTLSLSITAGLAFLSVSSLYARPLGFQPEGRVAAVIPANKGTTLEEERAFWRGLVEEMATARPDIEAGVISTLPLYGGSSMMFLPTHSGEEIGLEVITVSPGLFAALGVDIVQGRRFSDRDDWSSPAVAILNAAAARLLYGSVDDALGKALSLMTGSVNVVGVSENHLSRTNQREARPVVWLPYLQHSTVATALVVSLGRSDVRQVETLIRERARDLDPSRPVDVLSLEALVDAPMRRPRLAMYVLSIFAAALLVFALGVIAGKVTMMLRRRARDTAIRVAHGAATRHIVAAEMRSVLLPMLSGLAAGLLGALWLAGLLGALFSNLQEFDIRAAVGVSAALLALGLASAMISALAHMRRLNVWAQINTS